MSDPLTCNATDFANRSYSYGQDEPAGGAGTSASGATSAAPTRPEPGPQQSVRQPPTGTAASPASRALAARFASRPTLPTPADGGACVSVGYLRVTAGSHGTAPSASQVGLEDHVALESRPITDDQDEHDLTQGATTDASGSPTVGAARQARSPSIHAPPGPSFEETRRAQRVGLESGLASLGEPTALELVGLATENATAGAAVAIAGPTSNLVALHRLYMLAHEQGTEQRQAIDRDAANLAVVLAGNQALPQTYVDATRHEYRASTAAANRILTTESRQPSNYQELVHQTEHDVRQGREAARTAGLDSQAALSEALESNATFRGRYLTNAGFRHGVRAEVMLTERGYRN
jgi:hypothetical protein